MRDDITDELAETRANLDATRESLRLLLDCREHEQVRAALASLDRIAAELEGVQAVVSGAAVG